MKINYFVLYLLLPVLALLSLGGCTKEDLNLKVDDLPPSAQSFLTDFFPNQTPLTVDRIVGDEAEELYLATFADDVSVSFNQKGYWLQFNMPDGNAPAIVQERYNRIFDFVNLHHQGKSLINMKRTVYGETGTLDNGKTYAFAGIGCIGEEIAPDNYTTLPNNMLDLIQKLYPDISYQHIVVNTEEDPEIDFKYKIWLNNKAIFSFSQDNELKSIDGSGELLPSELFDILPEYVQKQLERYNVETILQVYRNKCDYIIWTTPYHAYEICTEEPPLNVNPEAIQTFIDTYFGTGIIKSITTPAGGHETAQYKVMLPNGFDFDFDRRLLRWTDVDGHGQPFGEMQKKLLPEKLLQDIASNRNAEVTKIRRLPEGYLIVLTNGKAFEYDNNWTYKQERDFGQTAFDKVYTYIRSTYPKDLKARFVSWQGEAGWKYELQDGTILEFDLEGNLKP